MTGPPWGVLQVAMQHNCDIF